VISVEIEGKTFDQAVREFEARLIAQAMNRSGCNRSAAARALGISIDKLHRKLAASPMIRLRAVVE
jgi:DNA-binding NtrC family response regulator